MRHKQLIENENKAYKKIQEIWVAQHKFKDQCYVDQNGNRIGEYGLFQELSGIMPTRSGKKILSPLISKEFGETAQELKGIAYYYGYYYKIYLPTDRDIYDDRVFPGEMNSKFAENQEKFCVIYAWPKEYGITGRRVWCAKYPINLEAIVWSSNEIRKYSGLSNIPVVWAAFEMPESGKKEDINFDSHLSRDGNYKKSYDGQPWLCITY